MAVDLHAIPVAADAVAQAGDLDGHRTADGGEQPEPGDDTAGCWADVLPVDIPVRDGKALER